VASPLQMPGAKSPPAKTSRQSTPIPVPQIKSPPRKDSVNIMKIPAASANAVKSAPGVAGAGLQKTGTGALNVAKKGGDVGAGVANAGGSLLQSGGKGLGKLGGFVGFGKK